METVDKLIQIAPTELKMVGGGFHSRRSKTTTRGIWGLGVSVVLTLSTLSSSVFADNKSTDNSHINLARFTAPSDRGNYNIGFVESTAVLYGGRVAPIRIWYPTTDQGNPGSYVLSQFPPDISIPSKFGAIRNAAVAQGRFPMIIENHPSTGGDQVAWLSQYPTNELLASHGFIFVSYLRGGNNPCLRIATDPRMLITAMLNYNSGIGGSTVGSVDFLGRIDPDKIGTLGQSGGGPATLCLVGGMNIDNSVAGVPAILPDPRIKAMLVNEPVFHRGVCGIGGSAELSAITVPYLLNEGSPAWTQLLDVSGTFFDSTTNALPRFDLYIPNKVHTSTAAGQCYDDNFLREVSFARQLIANPNQPLQDPLLIDIPIGLDGGAGDQVWADWNGDVMPPTQVGGTRQFCNKLGVDSAYIPLNNGDGFTTIPPFGCTGQVGNLCGTFSQPVQVPFEQMNQSTYTYTISFFKVYLSNDPRYKHFLTEDWTIDHFPNVQITPVGVSGP